jgi:pimeloyl-ACP methyl ester carboxylesterase
VIVGFSLGGVIAIEMATLSTYKIAGLLLLDMNGEADAPDNASRRRAAVARARANGVAAFVLAETWPTHVAASRIGDEALRNEVLRMSEESGVEAFAHQAEIAISRPRALDLATSLTVPTLILCGEEDQITPAHMTRAISAAIPDASFEMIGEAGHFAILERPDAIADIVADWVAGFTGG